MPHSRRPGLLGSNPEELPPRTPGLLGVNDAADPSWRERGVVGDTPGLLGVNDWADPNLMSASRDVVDRTQGAELTFSEHAEKRMWDLLKEYRTQVGRERAKYLRQYGLPDDTEGKTKTDCITYVINVLKYAFEQTGRKDVARKVGGLGKHGTELAAYLTGLHWKAHYWSPDVNNPPDNLQEHPFSYSLAVKTGKYYGIPVSGYIVNYSKVTGKRPLRH